MPKKRKIQKEPYPAPTPPECRETLGIAPMILAKRNIKKSKSWCPNPSNIEYDRWSKPNQPKTIHYSHVLKAYHILKDIVMPTSLLKSKCCKRFDIELYYKVETSHRTGSFHERSAIYVLLMLTTEQRRQGIFTASVGNWAMALAYQANLMKIEVTVVLPAYTALDIVDKCQSFDATVVLYGKNIVEAKRHAFVLITEQGHGTYLNGYDHPYVIAGAGSIGIELLEQLPSAEAILVPIGGGGLIAGIATAVKHIKPGVLIYGIEPGKSCSFFKAMENEHPYQIAPESGLACSLTVPRPGDNAFHTARHLIDKMVLVHDDWTARAVLHLAEEEKIIAEGAGAISLGALMCIPDILPELRGKKVVCIISGANVDNVTLTRILARARTVEGRLITLTVRVVPGKCAERNKILKVIENFGCNIHHFEMEHEWLAREKIMEDYITFQCETKGMRHAGSLKRVLQKLFPTMCEFVDEPFQPIQMCTCFPKKMLF